MIPKVLDNKSKLLIAVAFAVWLTLLACSVNVKDKDQAGNNKVDIETPVGGIRVNEEADVRDTGLPVYPGARQKPQTDDDSKNANVNISSSFFGLKVVAIEYESDDSPDKIIAFYKDQLKKFGSVVQCRTNRHNGDLNVEIGKNPAPEVKCGGDNTGKITELKVGTEDNQRLVSVEPGAKGSDFALVYIRARGKEGSI